MSSSLRSARFQSPASAWQVRVILLSAVAPWLAAGSAGAGEERPKVPEVKQAVEAHFAALSDYRDGDLLDRGRVQGVLKVLARIGWEVPGGGDLVERALPEGNFLVTQFAKGRGQAFMRKVASLPNGYSKLDRLSTTSGGKKHIRYLIRQKDGHLLVKYLTTTQGGRNLGRQMASVRNGVNLNKKTSRIYTAEELLDELKKIYDQQTAALSR